MTLRVIAVGSSAHRRPEGLDWDDLQSFGSDYNMAYCRAKLANNLFTRELARREAGAGIVAQAMHPGKVASNFATHAEPQMQHHFATLDCLSPDVPARTIAWLASDSEGGREAGRYFHDCAAIEPAPQALDMAAASRLWDESAAILARLGF